MDCRDTTVLGFARKEGGIVRSWHRRYFVIKTRQPLKGVGVGRYPLGKHGWQGPGATKPNPNATVTVASHFLLYYKSPKQANESGPTGAVPLARGRTVVTKFIRDKKRCLKISTPGQAREYFISPEEVGGVDVTDRWMRALAAALALQTAPAPALAVPPGTGRSQSAASASMLPEDADRVMDWAEGYLTRQRVLPSWAALKAETLAQFPACDIAVVKPRCQALLMKMAGGQAVQLDQRTQDDDTDGHYAYAHAAAADNDAVIPAPAPAALRQPQGDRRRGVSDPTGGRRTPPSTATDGAYVTIDPATAVDGVYVQVCTGQHLEPQPPPEPEPTPQAEPQPVRVLTPPPARPPGRLSVQERPTVQWVAADEALLARLPVAEPAALPPAAAVPSDKAVVAGRDRLLSVRPEDQYVGSSDSEDELPNDVIAELEELGITVAAAIAHHGSPARQPDTQATPPDGATRPRLNSELDQFGFSGDGFAEDDAAVGPDSGPAPRVEKGEWEAQVAAQNPVYETAEAGPAELTAREPVYDQTSFIRSGAPAPAIYDAASKLGGPVLYDTADRGSWETQVAARNPVYDAAARNGPGTERNPVYDAAAGHGPGTLPALSPVTYDTAACHAKTSALVAADPPSIVYDTAAGGGNGNGNGDVIIYQAASANLVPAEELDQKAIEATEFLLGLEARPAGGGGVSL